LKNRPLEFWLFCISCFGVVYGSLFPFEFKFDVAESTVNSFLHSWVSVSSLGDIVGNIALFIPFGFFGAGLKGRVTSYSGTRIIALWFLVAVGSQLAQLFIPSRDPSLFDLYGNAAGAMLGWFVVKKIPELGKLFSESSNFYVSLPLVLALSWLASHLIPFIPSIDLQSYKDSIKPLFFKPEFSFLDFFLETTAWVIFFQLLKDKCSHYFRIRYLVFFTICFVLLKTIIVLNSVLLYEVLALLVAGFLCLKRNIYFSPNFLAWALLLFIAVDALLPLNLRNVPDGFGWLPFSGFLEGSMLDNSAVICRKVFFYASMAWFFLLARSNFFVKVSFVTTCLLVVEIIQVGLIGRTPEITDPLIFLLLALLVWKYRDVNGSVAVSSIFDGGGGRYESGSISKTTNVISGVKRIYSDGRSGVLFTVSVYCAVVVFFLSILLRLPNIPYNVKEMFRFDANGIDLFFFALTTLSLGWCAAWAGRRIAYSSSVFKDIPIIFLQMSVIIFSLLWLSVTRESIMDIAGSSVFIHRVTEKAVLGSFGVEFVGFFGAENLRLISDFVEPIIRFGALVGPLLIFLSVMHAIFFIAKNVNNISVLAKQFLVFMLYVLPWLYFCKVVAFDWSSTDNLNELIARDGSWGVGGGAYLYILVFIISFLSALVCWRASNSAKRNIMLFIILVLCVPLGWFFLNHGLEHNVNKYGLTYSGVSFLLGPDRVTVIDDYALFGRWFLVQMVAVLGLAWGAKLYLQWSEAKSQKAFSVLMVCRHNICRSPMAAGMLKHHLKKAGLDKLITVDSAGTHGDMSGTRVDERARKVALNSGIDLGRRKSRKINPRDYIKFDYILAMDQENYKLLAKKIPDDCVEKLALIMSFSDAVDSLDVPDPYYGSLNGFDKVLTSLDATMEGLIENLIIRIEGRCGWTLTKPD
jgi:protein-tyrosine-phosphatase